MLLRQKASLPRQVLLLAVEGSTSLRVLLSACFAQLCFQLHGRPKPDSLFLWPSWAMVNSMPPIFSLAVTLLAVIASAALVLQKSPERLVRRPSTKPDGIFGHPCLRKEWIAVLEIYRLKVCAFCFREH